MYFVYHAIFKKINNISINFFCFCYKHRNSLICFYQLFLPNLGWELNSYFMEKKYIPDARIRFPTKYNKLKILLPNISIYFGKKTVYYTFKHGIFRVGGSCKLRILRAHSLWSKKATEDCNNLCVTLGVASWRPADITLNIHSKHGKDHDVWRN